MCSKENLARRTRDLIEYYFASRGDKSWQRRKTKGGVAEPVPSKRSSPLYFFVTSVYCVYIYIYFSCRIKTQPAFFIDNRSCKNRVSRNILVDKRGGTPRSRANKIYLASSSRAESKGERDRFETRAQTTRVQQHSTVSFGMRFDATRAPTPPTDSPSACTLTLTLPTSLHREPLSLHRPLLHPPLAPRSSHHAAPWRSAFPSLALDSHTSPLLLCTARSLSFTHLSPPPSLRLPPSRSPILRLPSLFLSFRFPFDSVLGFLLPVSRFFLPSSFSFLLSQFALRRRASSITRFLSHRLDLSDSRSSLGKGRFVLRPSMLAPTGEIFCVRIFVRTIDVNCVAIESSPQDETREVRSVGRFED